MERWVTRNENDVERCASRNENEMEVGKRRAWRASIREVQKGPADHNGDGG